jgi:hypothetical protein
MTEEKMGESKENLTRECSQEDSRKKKEIIIKK